LSITSIARAFRSRFDVVVSQVDVCRADMSAMIELCQCQTAGLESRDEPLIVGRWMMSHGSRPIVR